MTMLEIMKDRLPREAAIVRVKEKQCRYDLIVDVNGTLVETTLSKTCAPGAENNVVDFCICAAMMAAYLKKGELVKAKFWASIQDATIQQMKQDNPEK